MTLNFDSYPQTPHGGTLVNQVLADERRETEIARARTLPAIRVDLEAVITIEMITTGVLSPHRGFMNERDYLAVLETGRLADGLVWPVPLSFAPVGTKNAEIIAALSVGDDVSLIDENNEPVAILSIEDIFAYDRDHRAEKLFGTTDRNHPGVDSIYRRMGETSLGDTLHLLNRVHWGPFEKLRREPKDTWKMFYEDRGYRSVAGFITGANPLHRGHEYIHRNALEEVDGLFLQPLVELAKREYIRHEYRMRAYQNVLDTYYPSERSILSPLRVTYIFAGPREAILHALIMKNYGCTHALIGRDHAGVGDYYDKYASHSIFDDYSADELGIDIRLFHEVFYDVRAATHATTQTSNNDDVRYRLNISGTGIRELLRYGIMPPKEVVRPESALAGLQGVQPKGVDENYEASRSRSGRSSRACSRITSTTRGSGERSARFPSVLKTSRLMTSRLRYVTYASTPGSFTTTYTRSMRKCSTATAPCSAAGAATRESSSNCGKNSSSKSLARSWQRPPKRPQTSLCTRTAPKWNAN